MFASHGSVLVFKVPLSFTHSFTSLSGREMHDDNCQTVSTTIFQADIESMLVRPHVTASTKSKESEGSCEESDAAINQMAQY